MTVNGASSVLEIAREEGVLIVEDAPYVYINFAPAARRPKPFFAMAPDQTVHLFTGSKIGFPGPRVGFFYSEAELGIAGGETVPLAEMALTEASSDVLFQNPAALYGFEALLHANTAMLAVKSRSATRSLRGFRKRPMSG